MNKRKHAKSQGVMDGTTYLAIFHGLVHEQPTLMVGTLIFFEELQTQLVSKLERTMLVLKNFSMYFIQTMSLVGSRSFIGMVQKKLQTNYQNLLTL
jgi:hypothetical protein